jgi:hypothetical protein
MRLRLLDYSRAILVHRAISIGWIIFASVAYDVLIFHRIHPWRVALFPAALVPITGFFSYIFGRADGRLEVIQKRIDELRAEKEYLHTEIVKMRFTGKHDS